MVSMDIDKLKNKVFEKTGFKIEETDPVFLVVALNESVFEELLLKYEEALRLNNTVLDEKIGSLVDLHQNIVKASQHLSQNADQAHIVSALKAAAEAKVDIMNAARVAISLEVEKASSIVTNAAHQLAAAAEKVCKHSGINWQVTLVEGVISGIIAGVIMLLAYQLR